MQVNRMGWAIVGFALLATAARAEDIGFVEEFALAKDRLVPLKQLVPGSEDYYYYHCLHYLNTEQFEKAVELTAPWHQRFGQTQRLTEIQTRHALLTYSKDPQRSLEYLRNKLGLYFGHQRENPDAPPNLPTALPPELLSRERLTADSLNRFNLLDGFEDSALEWLAATRLDANRRRNLLQRLRRPDVPNLAQLVSDDLRTPHSQGFGSFEIHRQLTQAQLESLLKLQPPLRDQSNFVHAWLTRLQPGADEDWRNDTAKTAAYFDRLWAYIATLSPAHNSLKAHLLYHRLVLERSRGNYGKERFLEYLKLPRPMPYTAKALMESAAARRYPADLNADYRSFTQLPAVGGDEPLVRDFLKKLLVDMANAAEFEPYIEDGYLKQVLAEAKIEAGLGEPEQWASALTPEQFRQLRERVDIDFAFTNKSSYAAEEPVALDLFVKNAPKLIVKVFEINTVNWHRRHGTEIDTDINLDGLVPNDEKVIEVSESPLRRVAQRLELPKLNRAGVWIVDLIGAGKSSRALIRKGRLRPIVETTAAGQAIRIVDDANRKVMDGVVWLEGQEYKAGKDGVVLTPFAATTALRPIVLSRGDFACLDRFMHRAESYRFAAGIYVDRESLLARRAAKLLLRPALFVDATRVSIASLDNVRLTLTSTDLDGVSTTQDVPDVKLFEDRETVHEFRVPSRLRSLVVNLRATVKSLVTNKPIELAATETFAINGIDETDKFEDLHLAKFGGTWAIELFGKSGEPKPDRAVQFSIKHRHFRDAIATMLKTDARGRIELGPLTDVTSITATGPQNAPRTWTLPTDHHTFRQLLHVVAGQKVSIPYLGAAKEPKRDEIALFAVRGETIVADLFDSLAIANGFVELGALPAGDYDFWHKAANHKTRIRVVEGVASDGWVLGAGRFMQLPSLPPLQISNIESAGDKATIRLTNASRFARVHVFATRYRPAHLAFESLAKVRDAESAGAFPAKGLSAYLTGRNIGDEYRYVIDRKLQKKFAGNMLERPQLLLNPWAIRKTDGGEQAVIGGDAFDRKSMVAPSEAAPTPSSASMAWAPTGDFANLDFLADAAAVLLNLVPDKDGVVSLDSKDLGPHAMIHVVAVDPLQVTARSIAVDEKPAGNLDLRLLNGLDPRGHFAQVKKITVLPAGQSLTVADISSGRFEAIDSLARLYLLYTTMSNDPKLSEFAFVLDWPKLKPEDKRAKYSQFACHELSFFLANKDPEFFKSVILPYLANKKDKTFLDRWLLGDKVDSYLQPWLYAQLNVVEKALLARRVAGEAPKTARHLSDLFAMQPPNVGRFVLLFDTALQSDAMAGKAEGGALLPKAMHARDGAGMPESKLGVALNAQTAGGRLGGGGGLGGAMIDAPGGPAGAGKPGDPGRAGERMQLRAKGRPAIRSATAGAPRGARRELAEAAKEKAAESDEAEMLKRDGDKLFYKQQPGRQNYAGLYRKVEPTEEWAENNYYKLRNIDAKPELAIVNNFWLEFVKHDGQSPFLSKHLAEASRNFTEAMFAMAVLDLPFESPKLATKFEGVKMTATAAKALVAFHEEIDSTPAPQGQSPILVSQNFYRLGERYRTENGEQVDKFVTDEFIAQTAYGCQIVVTNPTSSRQRLAALVQLPVGAIAMQKGRFTRSVLLDIEPYRTATIDYSFYFPTPGRFAHYPVHVSKSDKTIAAAPAASFNVVAKPTKLDAESWQYVSQQGTPEQVLAFLNRENVRALELDKIAFRMGDRGFFDAALKLLDDRHVFHPTLWSYALRHDAAGAVRQFLAANANIVAECGGPIESPLLVVDPIERLQYEHLEYRPLVNARAHSLGVRRQIVNAKLLEQYRAFMKLLGYRRSLSDADKLAVVYYLILQDRFAEALELFATVDAGKVATKLQYDYAAAWLELLQDDPQRSRAIATPYANHPVDRWRKLFSAMLAQLDEIDGKPGHVADAEDRNQMQAELAAKEPAFDIVVGNGKFDLSWQNLSSARVNYYLMDVELSFSRSPFAQRDDGQFSSIRPNDSQEIALPANQNKQTVALPAPLANKNLLIEVVAGGKTRTKAYFANAIVVRMLENYGQIRVTESTAGKPVAKAYVKVYVRLADGKIKFHKDGYTDHRGRFDYASVSTPESSPIAKYAVLVLTEDKGASIQEASPPAQ